MKVIIDSLFARLIFNLTLAFEVLTEKQANGRTSDTEASPIHLA